MKEKDEISILNQLKEKLIKTGKVSDSDFGWNKKKDSNKKEFYLKDKNKNLFEKPRKDIKLGFGNDAVRSSAAMIFNLLGQKEITIGGKLYSEPKYEDEFGAIIAGNDSKHMANLDATLTAKDNSMFIAIEAKMMEWKGCPKNLSPAYLETNSYFKDNHTPEFFINFFEGLIRDTEKKDSKERYFHKYSRYDAIQMAIHILALFNSCCKHEIKQPNIYLWNIVWKYNCDDYKKEEEEFQEFKDYYSNKRVADLFKKEGYNFSLEYITFQDFITKIDFSKDHNREEYLKTRYLIQN